MRTEAATSTITVASALAWLNPWAAVGAFAGCCFFLAMPSAVDDIGGRMKLLFFSWIMGYGAGAWFNPWPPWSQEAMIISSAVAALASTIFTAFHYVIAEGSDVPLWLRTLIKLVKGGGGRRDG